MRAAAAAIDGRVPFLPGTGTALMDETLELTAEAQRLGAVAALVVTPVLRPRPAGGPVPLVLARRRTSSPTCRSSSTTSRSARRSTSRPATVGRLRRAHPNIVGIKETTRDFEHVSYVLNESGRDFIALSGIELLCYPMLTLGGAGHLSCVGNFAPRPGGPALRRVRRRRPRAGAGAALRPAPARRRRVRRDQPGPGQVDRWSSSACWPQTTRASRWRRSATPAATRSAPCWPPARTSTSTPRSRPR